MNLDFLYKYGYDYASTLVHPMANDGVEDFLRLTELQGNSIYFDQRPVVSNSCLAVTLLIGEGLGASGLEWISPVIDFLYDFRDFLSDGSENYKMSFLKIGSLGPNAKLCRKPARKAEGKLE
jgi:hypothetical protein